MSQAKVAKRHNRVAVAPRRDVLLVEQVADTPEIAAACSDADRCPRLASVGRIGDEDVRIQRVGRANEFESQRRVVSVTGGIERDRRIAGGLIGSAELDRELRPGMAAIEADVSAGVNRLTHMPARVQRELVIVGAANEVVLVDGVDRDRCFVAGPVLLAAGIDIGGRLERRRADSVAGFESRTAAENGASNRRRGVNDVVGEVDRLAILANDGCEAHCQCKRGTGHEQRSHGALSLKSNAGVFRHHCLRTFLLLSDGICYTRAGIRAIMRRLSRKIGLNTRLALRPLA